MKLVFFLLNKNSGWFVQCSEVFIEFSFSINIDKIELNLSNFTNSLMEFAFSTQDNTFREEHCHDHRRRGDVSS